MFKSSSKFQRVKHKRKENIWQLFHATDFESLMYPCFTFCRILGIFPCKIKASTIKTYKQGPFRSIAFTCSFCICELIAGYVISGLKMNTHDNTPMELWSDCFYILSSFIVVVTFILSKSRMRLIQTLLELSLRLPLKSYQNLSRLIHVKDILGFFIAVGIVLMMAIKSRYPLIYINVLYINLFTFQMDMLYMNCVCVLKACFKQVNDNLANLQKFVVNDKPYVLRRTYHKERNLFLLMEIKALKKQHLVISDTVQMLNMIFSLQLLTTITMAFVHVTFILYFYLRHWKIGMVTDNLDDQNYDTTCIIIIIYHSIKLIMIVWTCESGKNQAAEINITVHNVLNSSRNEEIKYEVVLKYIT
ncbi:uncharacterized protein LOC105828881 [Monomorium pharaonis]|uniref:uncharacterized protein LOC105828881 n=1 Tax=Monomorium pharaonis TaxID=307658 RepID=UPI001745FB6F|nr:uncharacterized protein LOC105828881 [Monomorium pharaonis]